VHNYVQKDTPCENGKDVGKPEECIHCHWASETEPRIPQELGSASKIKELPDDPAIPHARGVKTQIHSDLDI
jgi:hypothetical protein